MIAAYYYDIYLFVVSLLTIFYSLKYYINKAAVRDNEILPLFLCFLITIFIGFRPVDSIFADTVGYANSIDGTYGTLYYSNIENFIFDRLIIFFNNFGLGHELFFLLISFIYFFVIYIAYKKLYKDNVAVLFIIFLGSFSTFSYATNGIKAGAAASLFCMAIAYRENKVLSYFILLISYGFHHSMHVCIAAYICACFVSQPKYYIYFWCFSLIMAMLHITFFQSLFSGFTNDKGAGYLMPSYGSYITGMRYDFVLYSAIPVIVGYYSLFKLKIRDINYKFFYNVYLLLNSVWMLCMYSGYTNRIAYLSWCLYPIVISYPFLSNEINAEFRNRCLSVIIMFNLLFTLFVQYIYLIFVK